jgi:hypothetical protein
MDDECVRSNESMIGGTTITSDNNNGTNATTTTNAGSSVLRLILSSNIKPCRVLASYST